MSGEAQKIVLALIWRWIQKYDMATGINELLKWVQSHTGNHCTVKNFTTRFPIAADERVIACVPVT